VERGPLTHGISLFPNLPKSPIGMVLRRELRSNPNRSSTTTDVFPAAKLASYKAVARSTTTGRSSSTWRTPCRTPTISWARTRATAWRLPPTASFMEKKSRRSSRKYSRSHEPLAIGEGEKVACSRFLHQPALDERLVLAAQPSCSTAVHASWHAAARRMARLSAGESVAGGPPPGARLILRRLLLYVVDHDDGQRPLLLFQLQPELLFHGFE
jgi:hypothetical protein